MSLPLLSRGTMFDETPTSPISRPVVRGDFGPLAALLDDVLACPVRG
jgi:hypothetical protein